MLIIQGVFFLGHNEKAVSLWKNDGTPFHCSNLPRQRRNFVNKLYYGDNLDILRKFVRDETVDLCYIDPPFNSKRNYNQIYNNIGQEDRAQAQAFVDTWT